MNAARLRIEEVKDRRRTLRQEAEALNARLQEQYLLQNTVALNADQAKAKLEEGGYRRGA